MLTLTSVITPTVRSVTPTSTTASYRQDGSLTEGTHTNLFGVVSGKLVTAPYPSNILPGCTRGLILRLARQAGQQ